MPRKRTIIFAESAVKDLDAMRNGYVDQKVPDVGKRLLREIISQVERLVDFPESGRVVPEFGMMNLREIIYSSFRIVYRLNKSRVRIVRVWRDEKQPKMP